MFDPTKTPFVGILMDFGGPKPSTPGASTSPWHEPRSRVEDNVRLGGRGLGGGNEVDLAESKMEVIIMG